MSQLAFNSFHPAQFGGASSASYPPAYQNTPQQQQQANQAFPRNRDGVGPHQRAMAPATGGGTMHALAQQYQFPTTTGAQSHPAWAPTSPPGQSLRQTPLQQHFSPNAFGQPQSKSRTPPIQHPMAAPPLPQTPTSVSQQQGADSTAVVSTPNTPLSPTGQSQSRENQRVALLLEINMTLLAEVQRLQDNKEGGAISQQQQAQFLKEGNDVSMASDQYIQTLRRAQANFAYLLPRMQSSNGQHFDPSKVPAGPQLMTPPPHMEADLGEKYERLAELFPDWQGLDKRLSMGGTNNSSNPGATGNFNANGTPTTSTFNNSATPPMNQS